jgi:2-polyprenyl-3-methyl-5-hydroxy-6-metoxy-1,4-benzoquinol methylase
MDAEFYEIVRREKLTGKAEQWGSLVTSSQYRLAYQKTAQYIRPNFLCLDWGCGNGHFSFYLVQRGIQTHGYSFEPIPTYLASSKLFEHRVGGANDSVTLPYKSEMFDAVFSMGVLEHVHEFGGDQAASLLQIQRILKPGGLFMVFHLPNQYSWIEFLVRCLNHFKKNKKHEHSKLFTENDVRELLEGTSFKILEGGRYNFIPRNSFNRLPRFLSNQRRFCRLVDGVDDLLGRLIPGLCQNWYFILQKGS